MGYICYDCISYSWSPSFSNLSRVNPLQLSRRDAAKKKKNTSTDSGGRIHRQQTSSNFRRPAGTTLGEFKWFQAVLFWIRTVKTQFLGDVQGINCSCWDGGKKNTGKRKAVFLEGNGKGAPHKNEPKSTFPSWWFQPRWKILVKFESSPNRGE